MTEAPQIPGAPPLVTSCASGAVLGSVVPRLWTRPLRELTPDTSFGFDVIDFARDVLRRPLDPWQQWLVIHAGELLPDGLPRFRRVIVVVARQNGKTTLLAVLAAYWQFIESVPLILGSSTKLDYAREAWQRCVDLVAAAPALRSERPARWTRKANGQVRSWTGEEPDTGARYLIGAANDDLGRTLTVHRLIADELRQQHSYDAWDASYSAMSAVPDGQAWGITNAGSDASIVLNDFRDLAVEGGDPGLGMFEWSAPPNADPRDVAALAMANPDLGRRALSVQELVTEATAALRAGGQKLTGFKTERMCITARVLNPAMDSGAWHTCKEPGLTLDGVRDRVAFCVDVAPDSEHVTLAAAAVLHDDRIGVEIVAAWAGPGATDRARRELAPLVRRARPRVFGWLPSGPAAEFAADLAGPAWPRHVPLEPIRSDVPAACMALASLVLAKRVAHAGDPLLDAHVEGAEKLDVGDRWVFARQGRGHVDAVYAAAGAVQLARTLPPPIGAPRIVLVTEG